MGGDFHIESSSGARDSARTLDVDGSYDLDRAVRVANCRADMGTYEVQVTGGACCVGETCSQVEGPCGCVSLEACDVADHLPGTFAGCYGDADGDGSVVVGDRGIISANISTTDPAMLCVCDMDGNGVVNSADRAVVSANIGLCTALPDFQNGSGLNHGEVETRFPGSYLGDSTTCSESSCE